MLHVRFRPGLGAALLGAAVLIATGAAAQDVGAAASERCMAIAGDPDAGVPGGPEAQAARVAALTAARPHCAEAAGAAAPDPAVLFHLAAALEREGGSAEAFALLGRAAEAGLAAAETRLGDYYNFGIAPARENPDEAVAHYRRGAELGDLPAMTTLAFMHRLGRGVAQDPARMMELLSTAAEGGYHFAQYRLAQIYLRGDGIPGGADPALGVPDAQAALRHYRGAAGQGNVAAALELAGLYADDGDGIAGDAAEQARWTRRAAEGGLPEALGALGLLYETGRGVAYDPQQAAEHYVAALESGRVDFAVLRIGPGGGTPRWDSATAVAFQEILRARGLYTGPIDGLVGGGTEAAARALAGN